MHHVVFQLLLSCLLLVEGVVSARANTLGQPAPPDLGPFAPRPLLKTGKNLGPWLTWGGKAEVEYLHATHVPLSSGGTGDHTALEPELSLGFALAPSRYVQGLLAVKLLGEFTHVPEEPDTQERGFELTEAFLRFTPLGDGRLAVHIGRQKFTDSREWLYDEELDAVRAVYLWPYGAVELAVTRGGLAHKDVLRRQGTEQHHTYLARGTYALHKGLHLAAYVLWRDDRTAARERPLFVGLHATGTLREHLHYWLEAAHVRGRDGTQPLRGFGVDVGGTYAPPLPLAPSVTLGFAFGTGDGDPDDGVNTAFRQTGLQGNKGKFNGVAGFQYYGELLDPELSNLAVWTLGIGLKPGKLSSLDLVYHAYHQHQAADHLRSARLPVTPDGRHTRLGQALDLVLGSKALMPAELTLVLGYFAPGQALPSAYVPSIFFRVTAQVVF